MNEFQKVAPPPPPPSKSDAQRAQSELSELAMAEQARSGCSYSAAINSVLQTARGRRLYARIYGGANNMQKTTQRDAWLEDWNSAVAKFAAAKRIPLSEATHKFADTQEGKRILQRGMNAHEANVRKHKAMKHLARDAMNDIVEKSGRSADEVMSTKTARDIYAIAGGNFDPETGTSR